MIVLDASAVLAVLLREPGDAKIAPRFPGSLMSAANLAEVLSRMAEKGDDPDHYAAELRSFGIRIEPVTEQHARDAGALRPITKPLGLSLGDRLCLALAMERGLPALTTEVRWSRLDIGVEVQYGR